MYKFLDEERFTQIFNDFVKINAYCVRNKAKINTARLAHLLFEFLDADQSGELEPEEILLFMRAMMSEPTDEKLKDDAKAKFVKIINEGKAWFNKVLGQVWSEI